MRDLISKKLIGTGECQQGLYKMKMVKNKRVTIAVTGEVWHKLLCHTSHNKLSNFDFIPKKTINVVCDSYTKAKFTRLPFYDSTIKTKDCFDCDIWGKYRTSLVSHANYFLTIVDDFSQAVWVFLLKHKSEASDCLVNFHKMIKTRFNKSIKRV